MTNKRYILHGILAALFVLLCIFILIMTKGRYNMNTPAYQDEETKTIASNETTIESESNSENSDVIETTTNKNPAASSIEEATTHLSKKEKKKLINFDAQYPFQIKINRIENFAIIYGLDKSGHYSIPYKGFWVSTGLRRRDTPLGIFNTSDYYTWRMMVDSSFAQYAVRINGAIMLHSVPYYHATNNSLEIEEYNKLGSPASLGCIRFNVKNIKWIYDNCPVGTQVVVYDLKHEKPLVKLPELVKLDVDDKRSNWDPTDPASGNPWK